MSKNGFTLVELIVTVLICSFIVSVMTVLFVAELKLYNSISGQADATASASIAIHGMNRVLRWAKISTSVPISPDINIPTTGYVNSVTVTINKNINLPEITADGTQVIFGNKSDNTFEYKIGNAASVISNNITSFTPTWDGSELTLNITATKNNRSASLESKIHLIGV